MKKIAVIILAVILTAEPVQLDSQTKRGWSIGPLPAIGYNSDLGFQYGALADIFWFGDGSTFPKYIHKFNVEVSQYTKGTGVYHLFYDSEYLLKGVSTTVDVSYITDKMMDFTGFNGYSSFYSNEFATENPSFFKMDRRLFRSTIDLQGSLGGNWKWAAGAGLYSYRVGEVRLEKYEGEDNLYTRYLNSGIISQDEARGGVHLEIKSGVVHDTRDNESDPSKGFWTESILFGSPFGKSYLKMSFVHRGYIPVYKTRLTFAYRLAAQANLAGEAPFYMQQNISTLYFRQITSEGLGGINTLRGVIRNRVVGKGLAWANFELRYRFLDFRFLKQDWYLALNPFLDAGMVIQPYKLDKMRYSNDPYIWSFTDEKLHLSAGAGIKAVMNKNFIVSFEWGKPFDKRDGKNGMNIGLNYIF